MFVCLPPCQQQPVSSLFRGTCTLKHSYYMERYSSKMLQGSIQAEWGLLGHAMTRAERAGCAGAGCAQPLAIGINHEQPGRSLGLTPKTRSRAAPSPAAHPSRAPKPLVRAVSPRMTEALRVTKPRFCVAATHLAFADLAPSCAFLSVSATAFAAFTRLSFSARAFLRPALLDVTSCTTRAQPVIANQHERRAARV